MYIDYEPQDKTIELSDGAVFAVPERSAELYEKYAALEKKALTLSEYQYYKQMLELLLGKEAFKKIAPKGQKENLDRIARICIAAVELFVYEKTQLEQEQIEKNVERYSGLIEANKAVSSVTQ